MLPMTHHAQARLQQRGIPHSVLENLLEFGREAHDHRGCQIFYFDRRARKELKQHVGQETFRRVESQLGAYAVLGSDGTVVTVGHRTHHINRN